MRLRRRATSNLEGALADAASAVCVKKLATRRSADANDMVHSFEDRRRVRRP
jgi:hypothetical protein